MSEKSAIEWCDATWSPVIGCTKVSQGCKHCYAEREVETRWSKNPKSIWFGRKFTDISCHPERLEQPLRWRKARRIFVCPRADLFHEDIPDDFIQSVFSIMARCPRHTFQVLTKRAERMEYLLTTWRQQGLTLREGCGVILPNVWLGVSAEDQPTFDERWRHLRRTPAAVRFISAEPLLGSINLHIPTRTYTPGRCNHCCDGDRCDDPSHLDRNHCPYCLGDGEAIRPSWLICGGESGPRARPMHPDWVRTLRDQCQAAGVPFFFKQWGEWSPHVAAIEGPDGSIKTTPKGGVTWRAHKPGGISGMFRVGKRAAGRMLDGRMWDEYPKGGR